MHAIIRSLVLLLLVALLPLTASAQTGQAVLSWTAPTTCADGSPITSCPVTGYRIEKLSGTTWGQIAVVGLVTTYTHTGLAAGTHSYRVKTIAASGDSTPSNVAVKTIAPPLPGPPVLTVVEVVAGVGVSPAFRILVSGARSSAVAGFVPAGKPCTGDVVFTYRGKSYRKVAPTDVRWWNTTATTEVAAACA